LIAALQLKPDLFNYFVVQQVVVAGEAPVLSKLPEAKTVVEGQTVVFECEATGQPAPEV
jgi:hypothetical protein